MTNLTEQWKKGELPNGWYWVEGCRDKEIYAYTSEYLNHMYRPKNSDRIIEQVPSYEEYQKLLSDQLAKIEGEEINAELEHRLAMVKANGKYPDRISRLKSRVVTLSDENAQLKTEYEKECRRADELEDSYWKSEKENQKLKELLKECRLAVFDYPPYDLASDKIRLEQRIDEVLK